MPRGRPRVYQGALQPGKKSAAVPKEPKALKPAEKAKPKTEKKYTLTAPMRALVDKRVDKKLETTHMKSALFPSATTWYALRPAITQLSVATIIPRIHQATTAEGNAHARQGNTIFPKYCTLKLRLWVDQTDTVVGAAAGDRCQISPYIFVGNHRSRKYMGVLTQNNWECLNEMWRHNSNSLSTTIAPDNMNMVSTYTGTRSEFLQGKLNTDKFAPIRGGVKSFNLTRPLGYKEGDGGGFAIPYNGREFTFKIPMPKKLKYTDGGDDYPANYCPFVAIGFTYMSGADPNEQAPLRCESVVKFGFTDA